MSLLLILASIVLVPPLLIFACVVLVRRRQKLFVRGLTEEQLQRLQAARIEYVPHTLRQGTETGVLIRRGKIKKACRLLNSYLLTIWRAPGRGIKYAALRPNVTINRELATLKVSCVRDGPNTGDRLNKKMAKLVRDIIVPIVGSKVVVHDQRGNHCTPPNDANFHIFIHSSPNATHAMAVPQALFGFHGRSVTGLATVDVGAPLTDPVTGHTYGRVVGGNCLYIHHDVFCMVGARLAHFAFMLDAAVPFLDTSTAAAEVVEELRQGRVLPQGRTVEVVGFELRRKNIVSSLILAALGDTTNREIVIENCLGRNKAATEDGKFRILYHGRPIGLAANTKLPSGAGIPITTDGGTLAGELIENCLYIFTDLLRYGFRPDLQNVAAVLTATRREILALSETNEEERLFHRFVQECAEAAAIAQERRITPEELGTAETQFETALQAAQLQEQEALGLDHLLENELGREFDELFELAQVTDVHVNDNKIIVMTDLLYSLNTNTGVVHEIGRFRIELPLAGQDVARFFNQTRTVNSPIIGNGAHAPHVYANGSACMGNIGGLLPQMIQQRELATAVQMAIAFLESNNPGYNNVTAWPVAANRN